LPLSAFTLYMHPALTVTLALILADFPTWQLSLSRDLCFRAHSACVCGAMRAPCLHFGLFRRSSSRVEDVWTGRWLRLVLDVRGRRRALQRTDTRRAKSDCHPPQIAAKRASKPRPDKWPEITLFLLQQPRYSCNLRLKRE
jgi:hypothetical protein